MGDDDLDLIHGGDYRGMITDVANGFIAGRLGQKIFLNITQRMRD
jgi:hypothetical protein